MKKGTSTYTLKCSYYKKQFNTMQELLDDIISQEWIQIITFTGMVKV